MQLYDFSGSHNFPLDFCSHGLLRTVVNCENWPTEEVDIYIESAFPIFISSSLLLCTTLYCEPTCVRRLERHSVLL